MQASTQADLGFEDDLALPPVQQAGQAVVRGQALQSEFEVLAVGDVMHHADHAQGASIRIAFADAAAIMNP
ncbi:hypothetical protein SDC9_205123 [bioreactor metagenome]|uniref:Uncharacterized protein n=1 Tax=bioreactor metagenome TaxID=1076179 RepID=A0A645J410_9ZZZZ